MYASPATVSRAAMVYVDPKNLGYEPYWIRWLNGRPVDEHEKFNVNIKHVLHDRNDSI